MEEPINSRTLPGRLPQIHKSLLVELPYGFDAIESALLFIYAHHYFPARPLLMVKEVDGDTGSMHDIFGIMMLATGHGETIHIESDLTNDEREQFDQVMLLLFWLPQFDPKYNSVRYVYRDSTESCDDLLRKFKGNREGLLTALRTAREDPNWRPFFKNIT